MSEFNDQIIAEFRANGGKVEAFGDAQFVVLHTVGSKSGQIRETPLVALVEDDKMFVFASAAGAPKHPSWYHNLKANPEIDVEYGTEKFRATLSELDDPERGERLDAQAELMPAFGDYIPSAAPRLIPCFQIDRV
jgi:deazaflavin-dependent oxidoreductase (nitroreductase family)